VNVFINLGRRNYSICVTMGRFTMASGLTPDEDAILNEIREKGNFELSSIRLAMMAHNLNMTTERVANAFVSLNKKGLIGIPDMGAIISCCACGTTWIQSKKHPDVESCPYCNEKENMMMRHQ
jgi:rubrerythrin